MCMAKRLQKVSSTSVSAKSSEPPVTTASLQPLAWLLSMYRWDQSAKATIAPRDCVRNFSQWIPQSLWQKCGKFCSKSSISHGNMHPTAMFLVQKNENKSIPQVIAPSWEATYPPIPAVTFESMISFSFPVGFGQNSRCRVPPQHQDLLQKYASTSLPKPRPSFHPGLWL